MARNEGIGVRNRCSIYRHWQQNLYAAGRLTGHVKEFYRCYNNDDLTSHCEECHRGPDEEARHRQGGHEGVSEARHKPWQ